ncbi:MAG: MarR family transcriptional regulator [Frankiales bacterium]|nr:MarR family transcriptional regulator [Frankiales bacterium]
MRAVESAPVRGWTFLTNHAHVLLVVRRDPQVRLRDIAAAVGITERAVQLIVSDLEAGGYLRRTRVGRRNTYEVTGGPLRHPVEQGWAVDDLLAALGEV